MVVVIVAAFIAGTAAHAAVGWRMFATGSDSGDYGAHAEANAGVLHPKALGIRTSRSANVSWLLSCQSAERRASANQIIVVGVAAARKCTLYGSATTQTGGTVRIQLLTR